MATQTVTEKILADAKKEAQHILDTYKKDAAKIKEESAQKIAAKKRRIETDVDATKKAEALRAISQKRLELKKQLTLQKQKTIDEVTKTSLEELPKNKKYLNFLKTMIKKSGEKEGQLILSNQDKKQYASDLEKFMKNEGLHYSIEVSSELKGGIIVKKGKITYLGSLDLINELLSDELTIAVSKILY